MGMNIEVPAPQPCWRLGCRLVPTQAVAPELLGFGGGMRDSPCRKDVHQACGA